LLALVAATRRDFYALSWWALITAVYAILTVIGDLAPRRTADEASDGWVVKDVLTGGTGRPADAVAADEVRAKALIARHGAKPSSAPPSSGDGRTTDDS